jgi:hypothetical protein
MTRGVLKLNGPMRSVLLIRPSGKYQYFVSARDPSILTWLLYVRELGCVTETFEDALRLKEF